MNLYEDHKFNPEHICGYPIEGWRLDKVEFSRISGQPDGWVVTLRREDKFQVRGPYIAEARSDVGPLEAWDEALQIARRMDARAESEA